MSFPLCQKTALHPSSWSAYETLRGCMIWGSLATAIFGSICLMGHLYPFSGLAPFLPSKAICVGLILGGLMSSLLTLFLTRSQGNKKQEKEGIPSFLHTQYDMVKGLDGEAWGSKKLIELDWYPDVIRYRIGDLSLAHSYFYPVGRANDILIPVETFQVPHSLFLYVDTQIVLRKENSEEKRLRVDLQPSSAFWYLWRDSFIEANGNGEEAVKLFHEKFESCEKIWVV